MAKKGRTETCTLLSTEYYIVHTWSIKEELLLIKTGPEYLLHKLYFVVSSKNSSYVAW